MSIPIIINGINYSIPSRSEEGWGTNATNYLVAVGNRINFFDSQLATIFTNNFLLADGTATTPSLRFQNSPGAGLYRVSANTIGFATSGNPVGNINAAGAWTFGSVGGTETHSFLGSVTISSNTTLGDANSDTITLNARFVSSLLPSVTNSIDLGSSVLRWRDLFLSRDLNVAGAAALTNLTVSGSSTLNTTQLTGNLLPQTTNTVDLGLTGQRWRDLWLSGNATIAGNVAISGTLSSSSLTINDLTATGNTVLGDAASDTINVVAEFISNLTPDVTDTYDLGTTTQRWRDAYLAGDASVSGQVLLANGSNLAPALGFSSAPNTGMWLSGGGFITFSEGGSQILEMTNDGSGFISMQGAAPRIFFGSNTDSTGQIGTTANATAFAVTAGGSTGSRLDLYAESHATNPSQIRFSTNNTLVGSLSAAGQWVLGASGSTATHTVNGTFNTTISSASTAVWTVQNTDAATGAVQFTLQAPAATTGDQFIRFRKTSTQDWSIGLDQSDSNAFVLSAAATLGSNTYFRATTAGAVTLGASGSTATHTVNGLLVTTGNAAVNSLTTTSTSLRVANSSTALTGSTHNGIEVLNSFASISEGRAFLANVNTAAGVSQTINISFIAANPPNGAGGSHLRKVQFYGITPTTGTTGNANIADNNTFTGNWFINSTSTNPSLFSGQVQLALGTISAPALAFSGDTNTGIYSPAADRISIVANGVSLFQNVTNRNFVAIGRDAVPYESTSTFGALVTIGNTTTLDTIEKIGLRLQPTGNNSFGGTQTLYALDIAASTQDSAFTITHKAGIRIRNQAKGAASTITREMGIWIEPPTQGTNNIAICDSNTAVGNWFIHSTSTNPSLFTGAIIGATRAAFNRTSLEASSVVSFGQGDTSHGLTGTAQVGIIQSHMGSSAATSAIRGAQFFATTQAASFTTAELTTVNLLPPTLGAGSSATRTQTLRAFMPAVGTNRALFTDSSTYTGTWSVYLENTNANFFGGPTTLGTSGAGQLHSINGSTATTVGAAGAASALPATPTGYLRISINGTTVKIPYYND